MNVKIFSFLIFSVFIQISVAQNHFQETIKIFLSQPEFENAAIGIHIINPKNGQTVYALNENKLLIPASTLKLVTTAAALDILGADYRFTTTLGYIGETEKNLLNGDLVLIGGGDPALGSEYFQNHYLEFPGNWARKIKETGISEIRGNLVLDNSIYNYEKVPPTWIWEDLGNYYGAGASAFSVFDNLFRITFRSPELQGEQTEIIATYPKIEGVTIKNRVTSSDVNRDLAYVFGGPLDKTREIRGTIPKNRNAFTVKAAVHHPEEVLAHVFLNELTKNGILFSGETEFKKIDKKLLQTIYIEESPGLDEIITVLNHESVNLFAEHLVKQIAFEKTGVGDREKGIGIIREFWKSKGLPVGELFMEDGSGLSHFNAVSPGFLTGLLWHMKNNAVFVKSLPTAGKGTLYQFNASNFHETTLRAKSGSMTRVRCYAGYLTTNAGNEIIFSIMVNHFSGSHSNLINHIEKLLTELKHFN